MEPIDKCFGEYINMLIKNKKISKGLSFEKFYSESGIDGRRFRDLRKGKVRWTLEDLYKVCSYFGMKSHYLLKQFESFTSYRYKKNR